MISTFGFEPRPDLLISALSGDDPKDAESPEEANAYSRVATTLSSTHS
jgi:hypothetical protein